MKRSTGVTLLSLFLAYLAVSGIVTGFKFTALYGIVPGILAFVYGLTALAAAIGLLILRPWVFQVTIIWSIATLLRIFNMQFGLKRNYAMSSHLFVPFVIIISLLLVLLLYYIKKKSSGLTNSIEMAPERRDPREACAKQFKNKSIIYSYLVFLVVSFINFTITIFFISRNLVPVAVFNTLLNSIPIYILSKYFIAPLNNKNILIGFWISTLILSVLLVIPYGAFVLDFFIDIFRLLFRN